MARGRKFSNEELFLAVKDLLLDSNYEGFTFGYLADRLDVSRGAIDKYYQNKDELITDFMIYEMQQFIQKLKQIETLSSFDEQFNFLLDTIFNQTEVHQLIHIANKISDISNNKVNNNKKKLEKLPLEMYKYLQSFVQFGKKEGKLKSHIPDSLLLGIIFQSIAIPNHADIPKTEWVHSMKEVLGKGMFTSL
jgi:TetR/AcrR family transcriptional regulator, repressor of fatR-cypB operon